MTFRSLDMTHYLLIIPRDNAYDTINELGQYQLVHMNDCGDPTNRPFYQQMKRCDENLQRIQTMKDSLKKSQYEFEQYDESQNNFSQKLYQIWKEEARQLGIQPQKLIDYYEQQVQEQYNRYNDITARLEKLNTNKKSILQKIACYQTIQSFFGATEIKRESQQYFDNNSIQNMVQLSGISYLVGIVQSQYESKLNRMIFRVSRGYACTRVLSDFKFQGLQAFKQKVILILFPSSQTEVLEKKITRVVQTFCTSYMNLDEMKGSARKKLNSLMSQYSQLSKYFELNKKQQQEFYESIKELECIEKWRTYFWKQKYLYDHLNKMQVRGQFYTANIFLPKDEIVQLSLKLNKITPTPTLQQIQRANPPTAFNTNSYTAVAQQITDTYGVPRYKELNPTIFTVVTFPFFFGVMFGDMAHGGVLFVFGLYLIFNDNRIKSSSMKMFSTLRYIIAMMGFFAFYCGWIYNDFMGFNMNFLSSCYNPPLALSQEEKKSAILKPFTPQNSQCIYSFGLDPIWGRSQNELVFVNSLKMKLSVIIGVLHMIIGIFIKAYNARFYKKKLDFYFEFLPQIVFMVILFGYMDFLIVFKWLKVWDYDDGKHTPPTQWAPSIITTMMNIGMTLGQTSQTPNGASNMWGKPGETSQDMIQMIILFIALICVPLMLLPKPIIEIKENKKKAKKQNPLLSEEDLQYELEEKILVSQISANNSKIESDAGEIFVHQLIETIQFVLGAISNTASYLRLWALSLAHSQLAKVFFQKTLESGYEQKLALGIPIMFIGFYILTWITFGILMCMDSMECFLHSLRLHWVQFQNKFYKGDGYPYRPVSFKKIIIEHKEKGK